MSKQLAHSVTGTSGVEQITISHSHNAASSTATITANTTTLGLGDSIIINQGYSGDIDKTFSGFVKQIERTVPDNQYLITAHDVMSRAVDFFIASSTPDNPFTRSSISAENLVRDVMALAGLTSFNFDVTNFTFAVNNPAEVNLVSSYDYCKAITRVLAWHLYADIDGVVQFVDRQPYVMGSDTAFKTISDDAGTGTIINITRTTSDHDLRNRIVVYGAPGITAETSAASPHLPADFFKTVVLSSAIVDLQSMANNAASFNLTLLNRLTEEMIVEVEGDQDLIARKVIHVNQSNLGENDDWYIYSSDHSYGRSGYITTLNLRK